MIVTIGVYGFDQESFLRRLRDADVRQGVGKRSRRELAAAYIRRYTAEILDHADLSRVVRAVPSGGAAALLCVEHDPGACHRSLIARRLAEEYDLPVTHLMSTTDE